MATLVDVDRVINPKQLAERLGKHVWTIREWQKRGVGPKPVRIGWAWFYELDEVERWEREHAHAR